MEYAAYRDFFDLRRTSIPNRASWTVRIAVARARRVAVGHQSTVVTNKHPNVITTTATMSTGAALKATLSCSLLLIRSYF